MNTERSSRRSDRPEERASSRWLSAAVVGIVGVVALAAGLWSAGRDRASEAQTALAVTAVRLQTGAVRAQAGAAVIGESPAGLSEARNRLNDALQLLERGGPWRAGDRIGVRPVSVVTSAPLVPFRASLKDLFESVGSFQDNARGLEAASTVVAQAPIWERGLADSVAAVRRHPVPVGAEALDAVTADLPQATAVALVRLFPEDGSSSADQAAWVTRWAGHAAAARSAVDRVVQVPGLSGAAKSAWISWADAVGRWSEAARSISASQPYRAAARSVWPTLRDRADRAEQSAAALQQVVDAWRSRWLWGDFLALGGGVLALLGLAVWVGLAWSQSARQWVLSQDHRSAQESQEHIERLTLSLRKILSRDGEVVRGGRLSEDSTAASFGLVALVNRLLESREKILSRAEERLTVLEEIWKPAAEGLTEAAQEQWSALQEAGTGFQQSAENVATTNDLLGKTLVRVDELRQSLDQSHGLVQEGLLHTDGLRETTQSNAKRLKRLGESSQTVHTTTDAIRQIARRVYVYATNLAIESANAGESRRMGGVAQEIATLARNAIQGVQAIEELLAEMQNDIQKTVGAMEETTADLVKGSQASTRAAVHVKELGKSVVPIGGAMTRVFRDNERQTETALHGQKILAAAQERARALLATARRVEDALVRGRDESQMWRTELNEQRRRV